MNAENRRHKQADRMGIRVADEWGDPALESVLSDFRQSVHAWSDAAYHRPRTGAVRVSSLRVWRVAIAGALVCLLAIGGIGTSVHVRHRREEAARVEALRNAERQRQMEAERARDAVDLLAQVDTEVSREVPSALEPLAPASVEDDSK